MVFLTCGYLSMSLASAQQARITVSGKVVDAKGVGIPGAGVMEQGTTNGSITDNNGNYSLRTAANAVLDFSCIGYKKCDPQ